MGYENKEVLVSGNDMVNVILLAANTGLDEVVAMGMELKKKSTFQDQLLLFQESK